MHLTQQILTTELSGHNKCISLSVAAGLLLVAAVQHNYNLDSVLNVLSSLCCEVMVYIHLK